MLPARIKQIVEKQAEELGIDKAKALTAYRNY